MMRRHALERPYERLKELTRGRAVNRTTIEEFVIGLPLDDEAKAALLSLEPRRYVGLASELVERFTPRSTAGTKR
jgi:adenylosuccinate lyase